MYYQTVSLKVMGRGFLPDQVAKKTGWTFSEVDGGSGYEYGYITPPESVNNRDAIVWLLKFVRPHLGALRELGATEIELDIAYYHDGQSNFSLTLEEIRLLAEVGAHLTFSVYHDAELVRKFENGDIK